MLEQVLREKDREDRPTRRSKFAKASDAAFKKAIEQFPEDRRTDVLQSAIREVSLGINRFETCPKCHLEWLEVRYYRGSRRCRHCGYTESNKDMCSVLRFLEGHRGQDITVEMIMDHVGIDVQTCVKYIDELGYGIR